MHEVRFTRIALTDIGYVRTYTAERFGEAQTSAILSALAHAVEQLAQFPRSGVRGRVPDTFELQVPRTPFVLVYRLDGIHTDVLAVLHRAQKWP